MVIIMFQGFSPEAVDFLWGVKFNNNREWFLPRRQDYLALLDKPLRALADALCAAMNEAYPDAGLSAHVCRIYRDARRLHGRGPYKDHLWLVLAQPGDDHLGRPAFYFEIAPNYYSYGCGTWDAPPAMMARLRARIRRDPKPLEKLSRALNKSRFALDGEAYKRPKGDVGALLNPWYNRKSLNLAFEDNCEGALFTPQLFDEVLEGFRFLMPYYNYLLSLPADPEPEKE